MATPYDDGPLLGDYLDEWLARRAVRLRPSSYKSYRQLIGCYLKPHLGGIALGHLDRRRLENLYGFLITQGGQGGKSLAVRTVKYVHMVLGRALEDAVLDGLLERNPARSAHPPEHHPDVTELPDETAVWTTEDAARFLTFVDDHPLRAVWHLAVGTGARRGELLGLRWRDVDLDAATVHIQRALSVVDGVPRLLGTKTSNRRVIAIGDSVVDALRRHREEQEDRRRVATEWTNRWGLVFTDEVGGPIDPMAVTMEFRDLVRQAPVPVVRLHDTRHFHATALLSAGVPPKVVSQRLGHSTIAMTLDVYSHVLPSMDGEAAAQLDAALKPRRDIP